MSSMRAWLCGSFTLCNTVLLCVCLCAQGMKKRVGFQFNALEDTVESIGLEMVEQLALNAQQVGTDAAAVVEVDAITCQATSHLHRTSHISAEDVHVCG